ncbi:MAG: transcriptional regulator [Oscillospiraceae bacterium]|nr:transcriptional regulator [Oscillospiraceae bacterium]MBQ8748321.1 transcriptional regulator [Oscillospiraceae bacterium]MBQ8881734.1 transcriptional regulator [Oscillospiraceae bacterium]
MPKSDNQKLKIFYILDYLERNSHEDKPVRASDLIAMLDRQHNISCDRKTVYSDIAALQDYGVDIVSVPGKNGGYYIASRNFELPELKLLIDAVQSSRYLTEKKSRELIEKLLTQCNEQDAKLMKRNVLVSGRVKSMNETIYYSVDAIQEAIAQNKQITFRYFDWDLGGKRKFRDKSYIASPYGLCQDNENCYLLAFSERYGITSYRVDRMMDIVLLDTPRTLCPELTGSAFTTHANRLFQMYSGEAVDVKLRFHRSLINVVIDRFGKDIMLIPDGDAYFNFTVSVAVSPMFLSWVMGFGSKAKILYPQSVADDLCKLCREAMSQY